jgi:serine/threonine protein kinase/tetratricopeptide (TPR) repeat protein
MPIPRLPARYRIDALIGHGASADLYRVIDTHAGGHRVLALKHLVRSRLPQGRRHDDRESPRSLQPQQGESGPTAMEFTLLAALSHENIAQVYDHGIDEAGVFWFTLDYVAGAALGRATENAPLDEKLWLLVDVARALHYIHVRGIVHADLKPSNILVCPPPAAAATDDNDAATRPPRRPRAKLVDFGLARRPGDSLADGVRGSAGYMAPELLSGDDATPRSDLYSFGVVAHELLRGRLPAPPARPAEANGKGIGSVGKSLPAEIEELLERLLQTDPRRRPANPWQVEAVLLRALGAAPVAGNDSHRALGHQVPYIRRNEPLESLRGRVERIATGRATLGPIVVTGEEGSGKSRVLEEIRTEARLRGIRVFHATASRHDPAPHGTLLRALRGTAGNNAPGLRERWQPELEALAHYQDDGAKDPGQLLGRMATLLQRMAREHPLALLIDDLHELDSASFNLMLHLIRATPQQPVLIAVSCNQPEVSKALSSDPVLGTPLCIELRPFTVPEVRQFLTATLVADAAAAPDAFVHQLHALSGGQPRFLQEAIRHAAKTTRRGWPVSWFMAPPAALPATLAALLLARIQQVSPAAQRILEWLALFANPISAGALAGLCGEPEVELRLLNLHAAGLVERRGNGYQIACGATRRALLSLLDAATRRNRHTRIADWLLRQGDSRYPVDLLAEHARLGSNLELALSAALEAAIQALHSHALDRAEAHLDYADAALGERHRNEGIRAAKLRAELHTRRSDYAAASGILQGIWKQGAGQGDLREETRLLLKLAQLDRGRKCFENSLEWVDRASHLIGSSGPRPLRARVMRERAEVEFARGSLETAATNCRAAADLFRQEEDWPEMVRAWLVSGDIAMTGGSAADALDHYRYASMWIDTVPAALQASTWNRIGICRTEAGDDNAALTDFDRALQIFRRLGDREGEASTENNIGLNLRNCGDMQGAIVHLEKALAAYRAYGDRAHIASVLINLAVQALECGSYAVALDHMEQVRAAQCSGGEAPEPWATAMLRGEALIGLGMLKEAAGAFAGAIDPQICRNQAERCLAQLGALRVTLREGACAAECSRSAAGWVAQLNPRALDPRLFGAILVAAADLHSVAQAGSALRTTATALAALDVGDYSLVEAVGLRLLAEQKLHAGDTEGARQALRGALELAQHVGFREEERQIRRVLAKLHRNGNEWSQVVATLYPAMQSLRADWERVPTEWRTAFLQDIHRRALRQELAVAIEQLDALPQDPRRRKNDARE